MGRFIGISLLMIICMSLQAQHSQLDSIKSLIDAKGYVLSSDSLFLIAKRGQELSVETGNRSDAAFMLLNQGFARMDQERWYEADSLFFLAKVTAEKAKDTLLAARCQYQPWGCGLSAGRPG